MPSVLAVGSPGSTDAADPRFPGPLLLGLALLFFVLELLTSLHPSYGHFLDELYYMACSARLDLGYVDHPPLATALLALNRALLGDSLPALRLAPALCGALTVLLAGRMTWRLGGRVPAQLLAGLCVISAPVFLGMFSIYSTNAFDVLFWTLTFSAFLELGRSGDGRLWWLAGLGLGLAIMSKHTGVVLAAATLLGLALSPVRWQLLRREPWQGAALALLVVLPNLWWQVQHDWVSLEFYANVDREANISSSLFAVLEEQIGSFNPATFPVWAAGLWFLLVSPRGERYRLVGWIAVVLFVALLLGGKSRPDRIMGVYPALFAAGAVAIELLWARRGWRWLRVALPAAMLVIGGVTAPLLVPILGPEGASRYAAALGEENEIQREPGESPLLIALAHRLGSQELADAVTRVHAGLAPADRERTVVLAESLGTAPALELLGGADMPPVYSPHSNYFLWGPPSSEPEVVIAVGFEPEQLEAWFAEFEIVARAPCRYCMAWRQDMPIAIARRLHQPLREIWPELRGSGYPLRKRYLIERAASGPPTP